MKLGWMCIIVGTVLAVAVNAAAAAADLWWKLMVLFIMLAVAAVLVGYGMLQLFGSALNKTGFDDNDRWSDGHE